MEIHFLGVGSAFTTQDYFQSNLLVTAESGKKLLVDCGTDVRFSLEAWRQRQGEPCPIIDAVYISHLHADHVGGLEWLAFTTYFNSQMPTPKLYGEENLLDRLWNETLRGGLEVVTDKRMTLGDYFDLRPIRADHPFVWEGIRFTPLRMRHVQHPTHAVDSFGLVMEDQNGSGSYLFTSDTLFDDTLRHHLQHWAAKITAIFQECETTPYKTGVHAHYEDLCKLPPALRGKMWLYHYAPNPSYKPEKDGFLGFVNKGQSFR